ncbi:hypothetical protein LUZ60_017309 [Juncus effusus]|nr:hypothetical protein LUZ60_017309 [Juncus effusus]
MASSTLRDLLVLEASHAVCYTKTPQKHEKVTKSRRPKRSKSPKPTRPESPESTPGVELLLGTDETAAHTVISILSNYAARFIKDPNFRQTINQKCKQICFSKAGSAHSIFTNLDLGIKTTDQLAEENSNATQKDTKIRSLRNSMRLLSIVASLNGDKYTCGIPNRYLSACAQLYLSVVYRIERNDLASARHLLQVFSDAPYLARKTLLPDLWAHFFLPHLLHLKVWYNKEIELAKTRDCIDREEAMKSLKRAYNDQMDLGTTRFAIYYKDWLKSGSGDDVPAVPNVPLPNTGTSLIDRRAIPLSRGSINTSLYRAVFGENLERESEELEKVDATKLNLERSLDLSDEERICEYDNLDHSDIRLQEKDKLADVALNADLAPIADVAHNADVAPIADVAPTPRKSYSFRIFFCRSDSQRSVINYIPNSNSKPQKREEKLKNMTNSKITDENFSKNSPITPQKAINIISNSDDLKLCETSVLELTKAFLDPNIMPTIYAPLCNSSFIEGLLEISFTSKDEQVLQNSICILAELSSKNEIIRQVILNSDPQLEIFLRLLTIKNLFLKAAIALYFLKPKAKQMLSSDWIPLVLAVLDFGDDPQTLFSIKCAPKSAALYFLDQLIMGFDVDRNCENVKQLVVHSGLGLLVRRLERGDSRERKCCVGLLAACVKYEGNCRGFLVENLKKECVVKLLLGNQVKSTGAALFLLSELLCLHRASEIVKFLKELKQEGSLNTMHILLVYLQQAPFAQRPLAASILLLLDLLGDPSQYSVYREEAIEALISSLEHNSNNKKMQENCTKALLLLAGRFNRSGEAESEAYFLKRAGLDDVTVGESFRSSDFCVDREFNVEEEKLTEERLKNLTTVLLKTGNKRFLTALSNRISDGLPKLARACHVSIVWLSGGARVADLPLLCDVLRERLLESLGYDRPVEERVLASISLLNFVKSQECLPKLFPLDKETISSLQDLAEVTWTAKELLFACSG